jgi:hypothetical protein
MQLRSKLDKTRVNSLLNKVNCKKLYTYLFTPLNCRSFALEYRFQQKMTFFTK